MTDTGKTKAQLFDEVVVLRQQVADLRAELSLTERNRAEDTVRRAGAELAEWKSRYEAAIQATGKVLYDWNSQTDAVLWGGPTEQMLGYPLQELPGTLAEVMAVLVHPADRVAFAQEIVRTRTTKSSFQLTYRLRRKDGRYLVVEDKGSFFVDRTGAVVRMVGFLVDITDRQHAEAALRQAEEKYRSIVENAVEGIFQTTLDGHYLSVNPALARIYGYETPAELMTSLTDIGGQLYVDASRRGEFIHLLQAHNTVSGFESQVYRRDGQVIWITETARAVRDAHGALLYYEGTVEDITKRKEAELALHEAKEAAEAANRAKSEFLATMSHELRTPLGIILGYTDLLLEGTFGPLGETQTDPLGRIERSARELLDLITAVLDLSRLEAGRLPLVTQETQVAALLQEIEAETQTLQELSRLTFAWDIEEPLLRFSTDPGKLKVVLKNLIGNAVKFTKAGGITVAARPHQGGVELRVTDTGIGIPQEELRVIFEPFRQIEDSATRQYGGTGLGLYIVKRLLEVLGGTITVESENGRGSTFRVWLPQGR